MLKIVLFIAIIVLLGNSVVISRDYQDSWILEGLEIPFVLFVATYALAFFSEIKISWMISLAVIGRFIFLLIPNLKYNWFQGTAIDQHIQYGLANHVYNQGFIATEGPFGVQVYGATPFIHLTFSIFSIILNIPVVDSVKFVPVFLSPIYPLLTYIIVNNLSFLQGKTVLKYALFFSSIPFSSEKYVVTGAQFGVLLTFIIIASVVLVLKRNNPRYLGIFIILFFALGGTHSSSSVLLTTFLLLVAIFQKIPYFRMKSYLKTPTLFAATLISGVWLVFSARFTFENIVKTLFISLQGGPTPTGGYIPSRFFELTRLDISSSIKTILVYYGLDVFLLFLTLGGLVILLKMRKNLDSASNFLFLLSGSMLLLIPMGFLLQVGGFRVLHLASPLFLIIPAAFIKYVFKKKFRLRAFIILSIIFLAPLQLYSCQPLIPSANVLSKDLPTNEPIVYVTNVNSIYQRQMIEFAEDYIAGRIASDKVTKNQIFGLTEFEFYVNHVVRYYPLDRNKLEENYEFFLIHLPGISGGFGEQAEIRTRDLIIEAIYNSSIIYTNGESYILSHSPT